MSVLIVVLFSRNGIRKMLYNGNDFETSYKIWRDKLTKKEYDRPRLQAHLPNGLYPVSFCNALWQQYYQYISFLFDGHQMINTCTN